MKPTYIAIIVVIIIIAMIFFFASKKEEPMVVATQSEAETQKAANGLKSGISKLQQKAETLNQKIQTLGK